MILVTILLSTGLMSHGLQATPLSCPTMGGPIKVGQPVTDFDGARFSYCCDGCDAEFAKDPSGAIKKSAKAGKTVGLSLFDPVSMKRIDSEKAKGGFSDYKGIRFYFDTEDEKATFDKEPKKFGALPKKEALFCPVMGNPVKSYAKASGYADYEGFRYYFCCAGCDVKFAAEPAKFAEVAKDHVQAPATMKVETSAGGGN